jgi:hypothetical protein
LPQAEPDLSTRPRSGVSRIFLALIVVQAIHSVEEFATGLYRVFPPARFVSGILGADPRLGFAVFNAALIGLGFWSYRRRIVPAHPAARAWAWGWALLEIGNGTGHLLLAADARGYYPGALSAPLLLLVGAALVRRLAMAPRPPRPLPLSL